MSRLLRTVALAGLLVSMLGLSLTWLQWVTSLPATPSVERADQARMSSFDEGRQGLSTLFGLLSQYRSQVTRLVEPLSLAAQGGTLILAPPVPLGLEDQAAVTLQAEAGGTVLWITEALPDVLAQRGVRFRSVPLPAASRPLMPSPLVDPGASLESRGMVLADPVPGLLPLYGSTHGSRAGLVGVGRGRIILVTDPFILSNEGIRQEGNLRFAWRLVHALPTPIRFDEYHHGFQGQRGPLTYLLSRGFAPLLAVLTSCLLLWLWRAMLPVWAPSPPPPALPGGPAVLAQLLAARLQEQGARAEALALLAAQLGYGAALPSLTDDRQLLAQARAIHPHGDSS